MITFIAGLIVGAVALFLVLRKNPKVEQTLETVTEDVQKKIEKK